MLNWFVQTVWIFTRFSIQTIRTLNFIFVSALFLMLYMHAWAKNVMSMIQRKKLYFISITKKEVWHVSVLFTGTAKSPFSTPHIYNYWTDFNQIHIVYALNIYNLTHQI